MAKLKTLLILFFLSLPSFAAEIHASVDRTQINEGESFQFILSTPTQDPKQSPDFSPLEKDFTVLTEMRSTHMSIVNGVTKAETQWILALTPKKTGKIRIPAIAFEDTKSDALEIDVMANNSKAAKTNTAKDLILQAHVSNENPFVQSQIIYTTQLFYAVNLSQGTISDPEVKDAIVMRLGDKPAYQNRRNGRLYQVIERRYAIFPQHSGKHTITPPVFTGEALNTNQRLKSFQAMTILGKPIRAVAPSISLNVKPANTLDQSSVWLPAKNLVIEENWSQHPSNFQLGEPLTRTLRIKATGLSAAQLPSVSPNQLADFKIYPEKPSIQNAVTDQGIEGVRIETAAYIPNQPGEVTLPEIKIPWWNIDKDQIEVATVPKHTFTVTGTANTENSPTPSLQTPQSPVTPTTHTESASRFWITLTVLLIFLWGGTLIIGWHFYKKQKWSQQQAQDKTETQRRPLKKASQALKNACLNNEPEKAKAALFTWINSRWPEVSVRHLGDITHCFNSSEIKAEIQDLQQSLYASQPTPWQGKTLWEAFLNDQQKKAEPTQAKEALPPLYLRDE